MKKQNFDLGWEYAEGGGDMVAALTGGAKRQPVSLPHDAAIHKPRNLDAPSGSLGGFAWSGIITYDKRFQALEEWCGQTVLLEFEGVYMNAEVKINGSLVKLHPYGYTSFLVDLTPYLKYGADNDLAVTVNNSAQPNSRWYSGTGIYRHVWLRIGGMPHIQPWGVFVTTPFVDPAASTVKAATEVFGPASGAMLRSTILDARGETAAQIETPVAGAVRGHLTTVRQTLVVKDARLWSVDAPNLYTLVSEVLVDGKVIDEERTTFGIREPAFDAVNGFRLNGIPMKLKGGCVHHDNGLLGAASYDRAEERKVELLKASGFNAVRCAHNPPAPAFLDACDRLGMLVMNESFDMWRASKRPYDYHLYFEAHWQEDTASMVRRDRNHPSIILWSIGNEIPEANGASDGTTWAQKQADLVRSLDSTRPVTSAIALPFDPQKMAYLMSKGFTFFDLLDATAEKKFSMSPSDPAGDYGGNVTRPFAETLDIVSYNYAYSRYAFDREHFPGRVLIGAETFPFYAYDTWKETERQPHVIGDFVWTALDYLGESGIGKVDVDKLAPAFVLNAWPYHLALCGDIDICGVKRPQSFYRDLLWGVRRQPYIAVLEPRYYGKPLKWMGWGWEPVLDSWTFPGEEGKPVMVYVYAIDDEVELLINSVSQGRKPAGDAVKYKAVFEVAYQPGTLEVVGYTGGNETCRTSLASAGVPAGLRVFVDRAEIQAEFGDLAYITVDVIDADERVVKCAENMVAFEISGPGELIAVGTANPVSEELYVGDRRRAWRGSLTAVIRSSGQPGEITLYAKADDLPGAQVKVLAK